MKKLNFRPLRRFKKTGKICTPSYMEWSRVHSYDMSEFNLIIDTEYQSLPDDEFVHNHNGELLFFYQYDPNEIPIFELPNSITWQYGCVLKNEIQYSHNVSCIKIRGIVIYGGQGIDIDGTPTFSHFTADYIATQNYNLDDFEPLTVGKVKQWYGWWLLNLQRAVITQKSHT